MTHVLLAMVALAAFPLGAIGGENVVHVNVQPMPAATPALKYQLLPELQELKAGNPVYYYLRCFAEQRQFFFSREATAERARYLSLPLAELPAEKLRHYGGFALQQADWGARLDAPDWQLLGHAQSGGMDLLLPEVGRLHLLGSALARRGGRQALRRCHPHGENPVRAGASLGRIPPHHR